MKTEEYIKKIINTAIHNGMTLKEIQKADPVKLAKAYCDAQLKNIENAGKNFTIK